MSKMSVADAANAALAICDRLDAVADLNMSSRAMSNAARAMIQTNADTNARFALGTAESADFMHYFCTEMRHLDKDSESYKTMYNDPTSMLYHGNK